ncbi:hypothetical protein ACVGVM_08235 [Pseudonocardia bannensis]|uniref:Uncharacterized protein n=1 Tax=Pseudonocardia bannensis TaxID=630973 RepID=A0A848DCS0_9PSEU|nr:hypothetical protein [Pseudonocardia bannensis]NMH90384.1 hypothetical protein [Pseudonocardia bannensis]
MATTTSHHVSRMAAACVAMALALLTVLAAPAHAGEVRTATSPLNYPSAISSGTLALHADFDTKDPRAATTVTINLTATRPFTGRLVASTGSATCGSNFAIRSLSFTTGTNRVTSSATVKLSKCSRLLDDASATLQETDGNGFVIGTIGSAYVRR